MPIMRYMEWSKRGSRMASTGPGDEPGRDVEPVIAAGLPPQPLPEVPAILLAGARVERLIAGFLLGYRDRTAPNESCAAGTFST
jgi:hypothetical protein